MSDGEMLELLEYVEQWEVSQPTPCETGKAVESVYDLIRATRNDQRRDVIKVFGRENCSVESREAQHLKKTLREIEQMQKARKTKPKPNVKRNKIYKRFCEEFVKNGGEPFDYGCGVSMISLSLLFPIDTWSDLLMMFGFAEELLPKYKRDPKREDFLKYRGFSCEEAKRMQAEHEQIVAEAKRVQEAEAAKREQKIEARLSSLAEQTKRLEVKLRPRRETSQTETAVEPDEKLSDQQQEIMALRKRLTRILWERDDVIQKYYALADELEKTKRNMLKLGAICGIAFVVSLLLWFI